MPRLCFALRSDDAVESGTAVGPANAKPRKFLKKVRSKMPGERELNEQARGDLLKTSRVERFTPV